MCCTRYIRALVTVQQDKQRHGRDVLGQRAGRSHGRLRHSSSGGPVERWARSRRQTSSAL